MKKDLMALIQNRVFQHILFWFASYLILLHYFKVSAWVQSIDLIYTGMFHVSLLINVYMNILVLIPRLLAREKYWLFILSSLLLVAISAELNVLIFDQWIDYLFPGYFFIAYYEFWDMLVFQWVYVALSSLLKLSKAWFRLNQLSQENTRNELKALKSQINPHFFFNSLNSIYSLALYQSPKTPTVILKLGEIMRYLLYKTDVERIELAKEVEFIQNYVDLQSIRVEEEKVDIQLRIEGDIQKEKIAPLLFLTFLENSFKHGLKGEIENAYVHIHLRLNSGKVYFEIENNQGQATESIADAQYQGIGLANIRQRLELIYPNQYLLDIHSDEDRFNVKMEVSLTTPK